MIPWPTSATLPTPRDPIDGESESINTCHFEFVNYREADMALTEEQQQRMQAHYHQPFKAAAPTIQPEHRRTNALEYIAAQLGRISAALERIDERMEKNEKRANEGG